ncbi:MAG: response regulator [Deltaproteobacteria bacterium]|nr:response regulator [Deltaproteobacteria bacterium]
MGSILLVESDQETCDGWSVALTKAGHSVLRAITMREALPAIRDGGIDVVVIDAYDPTRGVVELARAVSALPDSPPLILISGSPSAPEISARIGAATFLPKPCEPAELVHAIGRLITDHRPVQVFEDEPTGSTRQYS